MHSSGSKSSHRIFLAGFKTASASRREISLPLVIQAASEQQTHFISRAFVRFKIVASHPNGCVTIHRLRLAALVLAL
ncbi:MAG: hypothetical protein EXS37_21815 [Opitutus sp.]|nr:hypothetical protein [Opitutus sp.]